MDQPTSAAPRPDLQRDGYDILPGSVSATCTAGIASALTAAVAQAPEESAGILRTRRGVYALRNVQELWPGVVSVPGLPGLYVRLLAELGAGFGLVRAILFDKLPEQSWALGWHRDHTVAVADSSLPSASFRHPTVKAGVPHVEAHADILARLLFVRLHLDLTDGDNGALLVLPGSHADLALTPPEAWEREAAGAAVQIDAQPGDALLMRPLLMHRSGKGEGSCVRHRRVLHLELAPAMALPDGYAWYDFRAVSPSPGAVTGSEAE